MNLPILLFVVLVMSSLKSEVVRLRTEERLSYREIQEKTGVARSTLSLWLSPYPLSGAEKVTKSKENWAGGGHNRADHGPPSKFWTAIKSESILPQRKGNIAEAAVFFRLVLHGFHPYGSVFDGDQADWVVETPSHDRIWRVQVRSTKSSKNGRPRISLRKAGYSGSVRFSPGEFDFLIGYDLYSDTAFVFSEEEISRLSTSVTIRSDAAERWDKMFGPTACVVDAPG